jgi:hypothetical protein
VSTVAELLDRLLAVHAAVPRASLKGQRRIWRDASRKYRRKDLTAWRQRNAKYQAAWRERQKGGK